MYLKETIPILPVHSSPFIACVCTTCCGTQFANNIHSLEAHEAIHSKAAGSGQNDTCKQNEEADLTLSAKSEKRSRNRPALHPSREKLSYSQVIDEMVISACWPYRSQGRRKQAEIGPASSLIIHKRYYRPFLS